MERYGRDQTRDPWICSQIATSYHLGPSPKSQVFLSRGTYTVILSLIISLSILEIYTVATKTNMNSLIKQTSIYLIRDFIW